MVSLLRRAASSCATYDRPRPVLRPPLRTGLLRLASAFSDPNESGLAVVESWFWGVRAVMNNPDHDTLVRAIDDARRILDEYLEPGPRNATRTVERLLVARFNQFART